MPTKVLLADDSRTIRSAVEMVFRARDAEVVAVSGGRAALAHAREQRPDVILADLHMDEGDGFWLATEAGADETLRSVPVVLLTRGQDAQEETGLGWCGAAASLAKPFTSDQLLAVVEQVCGVGEVEENWMVLDDGVGGERAAVHREPRPAALDAPLGDDPAQRIRPALDDPPRDDPAQRARTALDRAPAPETDAPERRTPLTAALGAAGRAFEGQGAPAVTEAQVKAWIAEALEVAKASWVEELRRSGADIESQ